MLHQQSFLRASPSRPQSHFRSRYHCRSRSRPHSSSATSQTQPPIPPTQPDMDPQSAQHPPPSLARWYGQESKRPAGSSRGWFPRPLKISLLTTQFLSLPALQKYLQRKLQRLPGKPPLSIVEEKSPEIYVVLCKFHYEKKKKPDGDPAILVRWYDRISISRKGKGYT